MKSAFNTLETYMRMTRVGLCGLFLLLLAQVNSTHAQMPVEEAFDPGFSSVDNISGGMQIGGTGGYILFRKVVGDGAFFDDSFQTFGAFLPLFRWGDCDKCNLLY